MAIAGINWYLDEILLMYSNIMITTLWYIYICYCNLWKSIVCCTMAMIVICKGSCNNQQWLTGFRMLIISMAYFKTAVSPTHWINCSLALNHRYGFKFTKDSFSTDNTCMLCLFLSSPICPTPTPTPTHPIHPPALWWWWSELPPSTSLSAMLMRLALEPLLRLQPLTWSLVNKS